ncbi:hypothetical protein BGW38_006915 [Lunasporangiospora selenospora]|uniref:Chitin-binding type-1 domain-containing protein n=1 Tax=Lunasporangiospora selenospora TaxID=979761 RepID=A0A9P6KG37_9FUNG|nr:hypothetical protein BGW38_006915 [Lunasporangiospora selenospora]
MVKSIFLPLLLLLGVTGLFSVVSAQASCGSGVSCAAPNCCSSSNFCGVGPDYCGTGCQSQFGLCGNPSPTETTAVSQTLSQPSNPAIPSESTISSTLVSPPPSSSITTAITPTTTTTTTEVTSSSSTSTQSTKGTFQLQPTGRPSGAGSTHQDKIGGVESRLALVIVFMAGLLMI